MTALLVAAGLAGIALPHVLRLERAHPATAACIWLAALCLRALTAVLATLYVVLYLPATELFSAVTHWCWHAVVPVLTTHLGLNGHAFGDAAVLVPSLGLVASLAWVCFGFWRGTRAVASWLRGSAIGPGPRDSVVVGDRDVLVASAGLRHPRVVVSAGALIAFDDEELEASLAHERGHIERRHRFLLVVGAVAAGLARLMPGTRRAILELRFHTERDADRYAVAETRDPAALASAICKAARSRHEAPAAVLGLDAGPVARRVRQLLDEGAAPGRRMRHQVLAAAMLTLVLALGAALPSATWAGIERADRPAEARHCIV